MKRLLVAAGLLLSFAALERLAAQTFSMPLIPQYSTFIGGSSTDRALDIAVDRSGAAYLLVATLSRDFGDPRNLPPQEAQTPEWRIFLLKVDASGVVLYSRVFEDVVPVNATFPLGAVAVDAAGAVYVAATPTPAPDTDARIWKLDAASGAVVHTWEFGGSDEERIEAIAADPAGGLVAVGHTRSLDLPLGGPGGCTRQEPGRLPEFRTFVARFTADGALVVARCVPGYSWAEGAGALPASAAVAVGSVGDIYVVGDTQDTNAPVTAGAFQSTHGGGNCGLRFGGPQPCRDMFVTKLARRDLQTVYATYVGGDGWDSPQAVAVDSGGRAYVAGRMNSPGFATPGAIQQECHPRPPQLFFNGRCSTGFVGRLSAAGTGLEFATYIGQSDASAMVSALSTAAEGWVYLTGEVNMREGLSGFPEEPGRYAKPRNPVTAGDRSTEIFVARIAPSGTSYNVMTMGGTRADSPAAIAVTTAGMVWVAGSSQSSDFPLINPRQASLAGASDAVLIQLGPDRAPARRWP